MRDAGTVTVIEARDDGEFEGHPPSTSSSTNSSISSSSSSISSSISSSSKHDAPPDAATHPQQRAFAERAQLPRRSSPP